MPISISFYASEIYAGDTGVIAIVPTGKLGAYGHGKPEWPTTIRVDGAFVAGTPFVIAVGNTSTSVDPGIVRISEMEVQLRHYWPLSLVSRGKSVLQSSVVQAGGRGAEASMVVLLNTTEPLSVPLFANLALDVPAAARGLSLSPGERCEVEVSVAPQITGRYTLDFVVHLTIDERPYRRTVAKGIPVVMCDGLEWAERYVRTFMWTNPVELDHSGLAVLWSRWRELRLDSVERRNMAHRVEVRGGFEPTILG